MVSDERLLAACKGAVDKWGQRVQLRKLQEECCELGAAINHWIAYRITSQQFAEEVADVYIMITQAAGMLGPALEMALETKLSRLEERLK